jgi:formamidopyrimidine-DNA glycosylase
MPELPEVETTRRGLAHAVVGRTITHVEVREPRLRWRVPDDLPALLRDRRIQALERRAKYLLFSLPNGTLIVHLGMSGSLRLLSADAAPLPHDHIDIVLDSGMCLRLNDPRRFGCMLWTFDDPHEHALLRSLGPEPLSADFDAEALARAAKRRRVAIKQLLMDQRVVVGVGNIYASEALFRARVRPRRAAGRLAQNELAAIVKGVKDVLRDAIRAGGTTLRDYVNADGVPGYFKQRLFVYERANEPCRVCRTPIRHLVLGQRSTYYCAKCQK